MEYKWSVLLQLTILAFILVLVNCDESWLNVSYREGLTVERCPFCQQIRTPPYSMVSHSSKGGDLMSRTPTLRPKAVVIGIGIGIGIEIEGAGICCNGAISDYFYIYQFENMFSKRNSLEAHAKGFWDYQSFITASAHYQPYGFGTTYMNQTFFGTKEVAAFLAHVGTKTSCRSKVATKEPLTWGLCDNKERDSNSHYCDENFKSTFPCAPGVAYYGRGALPIYWNYNYGEAGKALNVDLLNHPEYIEQNATLAFQIAIWRWMTPIKEHQPSAHDVFIGHWKPTKNDTLKKRVPGFGATMNVLYGDRVCGRGDNEFMNNTISHYLYYIDLMGVDRDEVGPHEVLSCAEQVAFNPSTSTSP